MTDRSVSVPSPTVADAHALDSYRMDQTPSLLALENAMYRVAVVRLETENKRMSEQLVATRNELLRVAMDSQLITLSSLLLSPAIIQTVGLRYDAPLIDAAVRRYDAGLISLGRAAEIAGLPYDEMIDEIQRRGKKLRFNPSSLEEAEANEDQLIASFKKLGSA